MNGRQENGQSATMKWGKRVGFVFLSGVTMYAFLLMEWGTEEERAVRAVKEMQLDENGARVAPQISTTSLGVFTVTAYCPSTPGSGCPWVSDDIGFRCCGKFYDGKTADGSDADGRGVAAPKSIAFGTELEIPGYGRAHVDDRGSAIADRKLDVRFPTHKEALDWGVQKVEILKVVSE